MKVGVFKTNIRFNKNVKAVGKVFEEHPAILKWTVDREDVDKVLRVELSSPMSEDELVKIVRKMGLECALLDS